MLNSVKKWEPFLPGIINNSQLNRFWTFMKKQRVGKTCINYNKYRTTQKKRK